MNYSEQKNAIRLTISLNFLLANGWTHIEKWIFKSRSGILHDLSAADLSQLDRIEKQGLFIWSSE